MSKILKTAAIIVGVAAAVTLIPGVAPAIGAALGVSGGAVIAATSIAALALNVAAGLTAKKPKGTDYQATGSPSDFVLNPDAPVPLVFGRFARLGSPVFRTVPA